MPCLASRVAYGEEVTPDRLAMIDAAERFLRNRGFRELRVRYHRGDLARVEIPAEHVSTVCEPEFRGTLIRELRALGFKFITLDLEGLRSGSLNQMVPLEISKSWARSGSPSTPPLA
jgi:uncharacterized protein